MICGHLQLLTNTKQIHLAGLLTDVVTVSTVTGRAREGSRVKHRVWVGTGSPGARARGELAPFSAGPSGCNQGLGQ